MPNAASIDHSPVPEKSAARPSRYIRLVLTAIAVSTLGVLISSWSAYANLTKVSEVTLQRGRAWAALNHITEVLSEFKDVETGSRGFVITGEKAYLEPYHDGVAKLATSYPALKEALQTSGPSNFSWGSMDQLFAERLLLASEVIASRQKLDAEAINNLQLFNAGKASMDAIRVNFAVLSNFQLQRIEAINAEVKRIQQHSQLVTAAVSALTAMLSVSIVLLIIRERAVRMGLEAELRTSNANLEMKVATRTTELSEANARLHNFAAEQDHAIEQERRRISREVHDQIGQVFTAIQLIFKSMPPNRLALEQDRALTQALEIGVKSARRITAELRPPLLDDLGLSAALSHFTDDLKQSSSLSYSVQIENEDVLSGPQKLMFFRVTQEACTNILRHARASEIAICGQTEMDIYVFSIKDNGSGIDPANIRIGSMGLRSMQERASLMGGVCSIQTNPGQGTLVEIRLPLPCSEAEAL